MATIHPQPEYVPLLAYSLQEEANIYVVSAHSELVERLAYSPTLDIR